VRLSSGKLFICIHSGFSWPTGQESSNNPG
jgi:hypothetical protein